MLMTTTAAEDPMRNLDCATRGFYHQNPDPLIITTDQPFNHAMKKTEMRST